jgi:hypothetical protein
MAVVTGKKLPQSGLAEKRTRRNDCLSLRRRLDKLLLRRSVAPVAAAPSYEDDDQATRPSIGGDREAILTGGAKTDCPTEAGTMGSLKSGNTEVIMMSRGYAVAVQTLHNTKCPESEKASLCR